MNQINLKAKGQKVPAKQSSYKPLDDSGNPDGWMKSMKYEILDIIAG